MNTRIEKLREINAVVNHSNPMMKEEVDWVISVAKHYESIFREMLKQKNRLDGGEIDGFDFAEKIYDILDLIYIRI